MENLCQLSVYLIDAFPEHIKHIYARNTQSTGCCNVACKSMYVTSFSLFTCNPFSTKGVCFTVVSQLKFAATAVWQHEADVEYFTPRHFDSHTCGNR